MKKFIALALFAMSLTGCMFVDEGKVGLRINYDNTVDKTEKVAGSLNQVLIGSIKELPVRDVSSDVSDMQPLAADATMKDVDVSAIYNLTPSCVSDLYINKSASFHATTNGGDTLLMYNYVGRLVRNAVYKQTRVYEAMLINDKRSDFEAGVRETLNQMLAADKLDTCITIGSVQARALTPPDALRIAADDLVRAKTEEKTKEIQVAVAKKEAERIAALNANAGAIDYMNAQSTADIAKAVLAGKVQTIIIPVDFKGIVNAGK